MRKIKRMLTAAAAATCLLSMLPGAVDAQQGGDWQKMSIDGATVRFEMPKPIKMNKDFKTGVVVYVSKVGKMSMKVGILKRNYQQDQSKGLNDEQVLDKFALRILAANKMSFKQMGFPCNYQFTSNLKLSTGVGKQYNTRVGKAYVLNRFYINSRGLYYVEAITQNTKDASINRFLKSFRP